MGLQIVASECKLELEYRIGPKSSQAPRLAQKSNRRPLTGCGYWTRITLLLVCVFDYEAERARSTFERPFKKCD